MTFMVVLAHATMTYGSYGSWFYRELAPSSSPTSILFTLYNLTNETWVMTLFFLLAGYFTPASLAKKGTWLFLQERFLRLGVPLLIFGFILGPMTAAMVSSSFGYGFWTSLKTVWREQHFIHGPMWFAQALLIFSIAYCLWRSLIRRREARIGSPPLAPFPIQRAWLLSAVSIALAAFVLRQFFPVDTQQFGMWLSYFAGYIFFFALGINARRNDWLRQLSWRLARPWLLFAILVWPIMPLAAAYTRKHHIYANFNSGLAWAAILYVFWESFLTFGFGATVFLIFRKYFNQPSALGDWLGRRAYAVYVIHPPVLVAITLLMRQWHAPAAAKGLVAFVLGSAASWLIADPLVRLPGLRRIV